jgi:AcrR family transcriptional regulator
MNNERFIKIWKSNFMARMDRYSNFLKLDPVKRGQIRAACYEEFLEKGFGLASISSIIEKADIDKRLFVRCFRDKEGVYKFLELDSEWCLMDDFLSKPWKDRTDNDIFQEMKYMVLHELEAYAKFPAEKKFQRLLNSDKLPERLQQFREQFHPTSRIEHFIEVIDKMLDAKLLKDGIEKKMATRIIAWVCNEYIEDILGSDRLKNETSALKSIADDLGRYLDALKIGLFK